MAAAAPSLLASSVEKTNGAKLSRLLIDGGTTVLRNVFDSYHPPANLAANLNANYVALNNLYRRRILHKPQWDLLFPPGGSTPDSRTFDITLLFLLLTNICGLSPPLSGWHKPPPSSDTSFEANLARIKLFRNELYGHVTSTGVQTAVFNVKWQEISAVLVALGLNPVKVTRLKSAPCGNDYIIAVIEWVKSDEEIKSQLREVLENQQEARQMQEEDHRTLQDTRKVVDEVLEIQQEVRQKQQQARHIQKEDHRTLQDTHQVVEEVLRRQGKEHQKQQEARQMQEEDHQTLQDTHKVVEEVLEKQQQEHQKQQQARKIQEEDHITLRDTHKAVEGVRHIHQDTHKIVEEVLKTQQQEHKKQQEARQVQKEDHRALQNTQEAVKGVRQIQQDTHKVVEEVLKTQQKEHEKQQEVRQIQEKTQRNLQDTQRAVEDIQQVHQDTHHLVEQVRQKQQEAHGSIREVVTTQKENLETLQQVKKTVEHMSERSNKDKEDEILSKLAKVNTEKVIEYHAETYQEGTRVSFFKKVEKWLDDRSSSNRVMVISGNAGTGKSVISAVVCKRLKEAGRLSGSHFCQHDKARYRKGKVMLQSIASQLSDSLPEYKNALVKAFSRNLGVELNNMEVKDLFEVLFEEPLRKLKDPGRNILMVIDGLDESEYQGRNELLDVIANHFTKLPAWIRFLVTTRPEINIADSLRSFNPLQLEPYDKENQMDLRLLFEKRLSHVMRRGYQEIIITELVKKSEGLILYAYLLVLFIKENVSLLTPEQLDNTLPSGISSVYQTYFQRLESELCKELEIKEEHVLTFLSALTAAREPLLLGFVAKIMLLGTSSLADRRKVKKAIACISALLPVRDDCIHFFHKSVKDWLTDISFYGEHDFTVDKKEGHRILTELCTDELDDIKRKGVGSAQFSDTAKYALKHGIRHMLQLEEDATACEMVIKKYIVDLDLVHAKLCLSNETLAEDILWIQQQKMAQDISEDSKEMLNALIFFLRKYTYSSTLPNHLQVFLQTVLNKGGTLLSFMASNLLQKKYPEIPHMEFVHKQEQRTAVLAHFQCSSKVACFDVSPQLDYMVCECKRGMIQLWSLRTGKLVWSRPVMMKKKYFSPLTAKRLSPTALDAHSFYRSVVFHPTAHVVLPGVLSHAYTFDGDSKPLFPESNCRFTACSISGDKTKMLTDCPGDAKCIVMWNLKNGSEISRTYRNEDVLSFAWSRDGKLLAISHSTGSISIVDAMDGFRTLAETVVPEVCGMIKFSPDCRSLFCMRDVGVKVNRKIFRFNINMAELPSCTLNDCKSYVAWECESHSEAGFLLGDPISSGDQTFDFVLTKQILLRGYMFCSSINMLNINQLTDSEATLNRISDILFSLSGETVYVVNGMLRPTVRAWVVSSMMLIGQRSSQTYNLNLVAVKEGVLLTTGRGTLELWNSELSKCVRSWTNAFGITKMIPISEERVACEAKNKVTILDTTSGEIVSTFRIRGNGCLVTCNRKCQLLIHGSGGSLKLSDGETTLWTERKFRSASIPHGLFSLSEQFVVIWLPGHYGVYVLDALSGKTLHVLLEAYQFSDCAFVSDEEFVISTVAVSGGYCLKLFNVKSGDLLSAIDLENEVNCLAACPRKRLLAIGQSDSKHGFKLIQVWLPQDKDSRKNKR